MRSRQSARFSPQHASHTEAAISALIRILEDGESASRSAGLPYTQDVVRTGLRHCTGLLLRKSTGVYLTRISRPDHGLLRTSPAPALTVTA